MLAASAAGALEWVANRYDRNLLIDGLIAPAGFLAAHWVMLRRIDRTHWHRVGLSRRALSFRWLVIAGALGSLTIVLPAALLLAVDQYRFVSARDGSSMLSAAYDAWILLPAAFGEELFSRGYLFSVLRESLGPWSAVAITSVGFGFLHLWNPGADAYSLLAVSLGGVFLAVVLLRTGSLYAAIAAHFTWNWTIAAVLHANVSGIQASEAPPDYRLVERGPDWLTGGPWGPEGGLLASLVVVLTTLALLRGLRTERVNA